MQLEAYVNQTDASELRLAMSADVTLDAFSGLHFRGKIYSIGALATSGWRQNYYIRNLPVRVQIEGNDPRLIPDLSGAANVLLVRKENAVMVPQEAVQMEGAKTVVYVKRGARYVKQEVQTGLSTNTDIEITAGLQPGEEVALERPSSPAS
jgi:multidrug efflux pump subunit AcrA (membrane-fusion protein)